MEKVWPLLTFNVSCLKLLLLVKIFMRKLLSLHDTKFLVFLPVFFFFFFLLIFGLCGLFYFLRNPWVVGLCCALFTHL